MVISLKHSLSFIQMRNKTDMSGPTVKGLILQPLSHKLCTDTAFGSDSLSSIMYCKWIKLMRPSPFCCWTVFISLIYIHKSYSVSQLNLLCCWLNEKCKCRAITDRYLSGEQTCVVYYLHLYGRCPVSICVLILSLSLSVIIQDLLLNRSQKKHRPLS